MKKLLKKIKHYFLILLCIISYTSYSQDYNYFGTLIESNGKKIELRVMAYNSDCSQDVKRYYTGIYVEDTKNLKYFKQNLSWKLRYYDCQGELITLPLNFDLKDMNSGLNTNVNMKFVGKIPEEKFYYDVVNSGSKISEVKQEQNNSVVNNDNQDQSSSSIIDKIFASLTPSERQYVEKILQSNDDPKGIMDRKCGVSYSKCKWCGKTISYNKVWASKIQSIKAFKDPYMSALGGLFMGVGGALGGYSESEMVEKWSRDLKKDIREIKAGNIYFCHEGTAPKFCSKKCEYEFSYH